MVSSVFFLPVFWACVSLVTLLVLVACPGLWGICLLGCFVGFPYMGFVV